jgi:hypothetical protein
VSNAQRTRIRLGTDYVCIFNEPGARTSTWKWTPRRHEATVFPTKLDAGRIAERVKHTLPPGTARKIKLERA